MSRREENGDRELSTGLRHDTRNPRAAAVPESPRWAGVVSAWQD
jgi:hypothetical protein